MKLVLVSLALMLLVSQINASCLCGASGTDYCSCSGVRPIPRILEKGLSNLTPIGDRCYCGNQVVEPAVPPKPCACSKVREGLEWLHSVNNLVSRQILTNAIALKQKSIAALNSKLEQLEKPYLCKRSILT